MIKMNSSFTNKPISMHPLAKIFLDAFICSKCNCDYDCHFALKYDNDVINTDYFKIICSFCANELRRMHPVAKIFLDAFVCCKCNSNYDCDFAVKYNGDLITYTDYFEVLCSCCAHELSKD